MTTMILPKKKHYDSMFGTQKTPFISFCCFFVGSKVNFERNYVWMVNAANSNHLR